LRVLLIEDDAILADGLIRSLKQADYAVDWSSDGEEAEVILRTQTSDLVILDLTLPHRTGWNCCADSAIAEVRHRF